MMKLLEFLKKLNFLARMEEEKRKALLNKVMMGFVYVSAVIAIVCMIYLKTSKIRIKDNTVELGDKYYETELFSSENIKVSDGYYYRVKTNNIDINKVGEYEVVFAVSGYGEQVEDTKTIKVVDTTPAEVEMKNTEFFVGDKIDLTKELVITDLSNDGVIPYAEANVKVNKDFDTTKAGESTIKVTTTDKNGVTGETELTITVKEPIVSLKAYMEEQFTKNNNDGKNEYSILTTDGDFIVKCKTGTSVYYTINFTDRVYYYTSGTTYVYSDTIYFDASAKATKWVDVSPYWTDTYTSGSSLSSAQRTLTKALTALSNVLEDKNAKLELVGKNAEQIKTEKIDLRTLD